VSLFNFGKEKGKFADRAWKRNEKIHIRLVKGILNIPGLKVLFPLLIFYPPNKMKS
jgi:hypothetical protein